MQAGSSPVSLVSPNQTCGRSFKLQKPLRSEKVLTAKATAKVFGVPLLKLDAGRIFAGLVGQSESNLRAVIQTAEAIAPCCLWIDEVEKGFSGTKSSNATDGGTSSRVFGSFISWMQEKAEC